MDLDKNYSEAVSIAYATRWNLIDDKQFCLRLKRRFMDVVKEDMAEVEVTEEDTVDRNNWRRKICCVDSWWEKPKEEEEVLSHLSGYVS